MQIMEDKEYLKMFAQRVRTLREEQGISQEKLCREGRTPSYLYRYGGTS